MPGVRSLSKKGRWVYRDEAVAVNYFFNKRIILAPPAGVAKVERSSKFAGLYSTGAATGGGGTTPPYTGGFSNDGLRFLIPVPTNMTGYVSWVVERAQGLADEYFQLSPHLMPSMPMYPDGTVYDNRRAYYKVYGIAASGVRTLLGSYDAVQPLRPGWEEGGIDVTVNNTILRGRRFRNASGDAIRIASGITGTVIEDCDIAATNHGVSCGNISDVVVRYNRGWGLNPNVLDAGQGCFVSAYRSTSVIVEHNHNEEFKFQTLANGDMQQILQTMLCRYNRSLNLNSKKSDGAGGYQFHATNDVRSYPIGHFFQVANAYRMARCEVSWNEVINIAGKSFTEDVLNFYNSSGTSTSGMLCHDNLLYGAYSIAPNTGPNSGCGIITDGYGVFEGPVGYVGAYGTREVAKYDPVPAGAVAKGKLADPTLNGYQKFYNNVIIGTSNAGIGVGGGCFIEVYGNRTVSSGLTYDGLSIYGNNVGIYAGAQYDNRVNAMDNISIHDNYSTWWQEPYTVQRQGMATGSNNPYYFYTATTAQLGMYITNFTESNNSSGPRATLADEKKEHVNWKIRAQGAGIEAGENDYRFPTAGAMILTADDGYATPDATVRAIAESRGKRMTFGIITSQIGATGSHTAAELQAYQRAGHELVSHSVTHASSLSSMTDANALIEERDSQAALAAIGIKTRVIIWPYGVGNGSYAKDTAAPMFYDYGLGTGGNTPQALPPYDRYNFGRQAFASYAEGQTTIGAVTYYQPGQAGIPGGGLLTNSLEFYKARVLQAKQENRVLVWMIHPWEGGFNATQQGFLGQLIDYADSIGLPTRTLTRGA